MEQDRRNQRSVLLDIPSPEGRKVFFRLLKSTHVLIETSKGGQWKKWGLTDEVLWEQNPALVIVHASGFGQEGDPSHVSLASYDPIAQAFSGLMALQGDQSSGDVLAAPQTGDTVLALFIATAALAALLRAEKTGKGESVDIAQYECLARVLHGVASEYFMDGVQLGRIGSAKHYNVAGMGTYVCKDGTHVYIGCAGGGVLKRSVPEFGLEYGSELFPEGISNVFANTPAAPVFDAAIEAYCKERDAAEVVANLSRLSIPCSLIMEFKDMLENPHYIARQTVTEWDTMDGKKFKGINIVPKFKNFPGQIRRGAPSAGLDTEEVLSELGYSQTEIGKLYGLKIIAKEQL
jgi:L-carnitine CoA-transferase